MLRLWGSTKLAAATTARRGSDTRRRSSLTSRVSPSQRSKQLPPLQQQTKDDIDVLGVDELDRILNNTKSSISESVRQLVEHAGDVHTQLERELALVRKAGSHGINIAKEAADVYERFASIEQMLDSKDAELNRTTSLNVELNQQISDLNRDLENERRSRAQRIEQLQRELQEEKTAHQRVQQALRRVQSIISELPPT